MPDLNAHICVFCGDFCADGDRIACTAHRARMDAERMPWDAKPERVLSGDVVKLQGGPGSVGSTPGAVHHEPD